MTLPKQALRVGARWTAMQEGPERHFEIISAGRAGVELRCVVTGGRRNVTRRALADRDEWRTGWLRIDAG